MKKIILFLMLIILATIGEQTVQAATVDTSSVTTELTIPDSTKLTAKEVYEDIKAGITGLATALKTPAEHVYAILCKQQIVKAVIGIFMFLIPLIFIICSLRYGSFVVDWDEWIIKDGRSQFSPVIFFTCGIIGIIFMIIFFIGGYHLDILQGFINPEYGAIKDIANFIK